MAWFRRSSSDGLLVGPPTSTALTQPRVSELGEAELQWIAGYLDALARSGIADGDIDAIGNLFDAELQVWLGLGHDERPDPNELINRLGIGFGDCIRRRSGTAWVLATDEHGTEIAIHGQPGDILMFPTNMVAKRWVAGEVGALPALASATIRAIEDVRSRAR